MNSFKEWLSDYLRYFILALAVLLAAGAIVLGVKLYQQTKSAQETQAQADPNNIVIVGESETEDKETEMPEKGTENETKEETKKETEKDTEKETQTETSRGVNAKPETVGDAETKQPETKKQENVPAGTKQSEKPAVPEETSKQNNTEKQIQPETARKEPPVIIPIQTEARQTETPQTDPPQTEPPETDPPEPVYMTLNGACNFRSYPDYGDNIITYYSEGTVVEFLEDVGGWYKVQIDGMVGYMGAKFLN